MYDLNYCPHCGTKLQLQELENEGLVPYCKTCKDYRFPIFNAAVSMVCFNPTMDKVLLIQQYGRDTYILPAGYINKGEDAEDAVKREIKEELGLTVTKAWFNRSHFFKPSETLMLNFSCVVSNEEVHENFEIDKYTWFSIEDAKKNIRPNSLAQQFLLGYFNKQYDFK